MSASSKALTTGIVGFLLGVASTSFVHGQGETVSGTATHIGFAVRDVDKSAKAFSELFGVTVPPAQTLFAHTLCTNRRLAEQVPEGALLQIVSTNPPQAAPASPRSRRRPPAG